MSHTAHPAEAAAIVLVAAGSGTRLGAGVPKAFVRIAEQSVLHWCVRSVCAAGDVLGQLVAVVPAGFVDSTRAELAQLLERIAPHVALAVVSGGADRADSVRAGLAAVDASRRVVLVHDAARAAVPADLVRRMVASIQDAVLAATPVLPVADTLSRLTEHPPHGGATLASPVDRSAVVAVQTPQAFDRAALIAAHNAAAQSGETFTDDASVMRAAGHEIRTVPGDPAAMKLTTPADLELLRRLLPTAASTNRLRVGTGTDVHAFDPQADLCVAGLTWPGEPGLAGHSDGDVVAHAIVDALLAAAGLGDIGLWFGTSNAEYRNASGEVFLRATARLLAERGIRPCNVSVQLIGVRPKVSPRRGEAETLLSEWVGAPVSFSATTTDGLGFTGRGEGLCAIATALVEHPDEAAHNRHVTSLTYSEPAR